MKKHRLLKLFIILFSLSILQGCQQIRLLQFKNQFKSFKESFVFSSQTIAFKQPILQSSDVLYLTKTDPSMTTTDAESKIWHYDLIKKSSRDELKAFNLSFQLYFQDNRLRKLVYPNQLSKLFGDNLMTLGFQSIAKGTYLAKPNVVIPGQPDSYRIEKQDLPTRDKVIQHFGFPSEIETKDNLEIYYYRYTVDNEQKEKSLPWMAFVFKKEDSVLIEVSGTLFGPFMQFNLSGKAKK